jgi:hypothetical protein
MERTDRSRHEYIARASFQVSVSLAILEWSGLQRFGASGVFECWMFDVGLWMRGLVMQVNAHQGEMA